MASNGTMYGWVGKILRVDLSSGKIWEVPTSNYVPDFIGGRGVAAKIWWDDGVSPKISAFDPENRVMFMTGPTTGTPAMNSGRVEVLGKAPQTGPLENWTRSGCGGHWGPELKFAGYDGVVVQGKAAKPVYLWINDGKAEIRDASHLWGLDTVQAQQIIWDTHGRRTRSMVIGKAGEKMTRIGCVMTDTGDAAGQGGFGSVMGSKNLKAVAVRGTGTVKVADPQRLLEITRYCQKLFARPAAKDDTFAPNEAGFYFNVTGGVVNRASGTPSSGELWNLIKSPGSGYSRRNDGCFNCAVGCRASQNGPDIIPGVALCRQAGWYTQFTSVYEPSKGYSRVTWNAAKLGDLYGINAEDLSGQTRWLTLCFQEGLLTDKDTGLPLSKIGSWEFAQALTSGIAERKGFGMVLGEGCQRAADQIGGRARTLFEINYPRAGRFGGYKEHWLWHSGFPGGYAIPEAIMIWLFDGRDPLNSHDFWSSIKGAALVANSGGKVTKEVIDLLRAASKRTYGSEKAVEFYTPDMKAINWEYKAQATKQYTAMSALKDSYIVCDWAFPYVFNPNSADHVGDSSIESQMFSAVTGIELGEQESFKYGERIYTLERAIMALEGRNRSDDVLHDVWYDTPDAGGRKTDRADVEKAKDEFYGLYGWDVKTGMPTRKSLEDRGLKAVADGLAKAGVLPG